MGGSNKGYEFWDRLSFRVAGKGLLLREMVVYIFVVLVVLWVIHSGYAVFFFLETLAFSTTVEHSLLTAIVYTVVQDGLLVLYFLLTWMYNRFVGITYDNLDLGNIYGVFVVNGVLVGVACYVTFIQWLDYGLQASTGDGHSEYEVGPVPIHNVLMMVSLVSSVVAVVVISANIQHFVQSSGSVGVLFSAIQKRNAQRAARARNPA